MGDLDAVFAAVAKLPFTDAGRMGIAGASYGGYAVNWIIGHTNRFKAAVTHDGVFNLESMSMATEELWFSEWEFGGRPWDAKARAQFAKWSPHLFAHKHQDTDAHHHERAGLPRAGRSGPADVHRPAPKRRAERSARVPRRGTLGPEGAQQPDLARGRVRLDEEISLEVLIR